MLIAKYSCCGCEAVDIEVAIPAREPEQGVVEYVEMVAVLVALNHADRNCSSLVCDLKIPMTSKGVGYAIIN